MVKRRTFPSRAKAHEILSDGTVHGQPLTKKQRGLFGALASGQPLRRARQAKKPAR